jgi:hypothetical protein
MLFLELGVNTFTNLTAQTNKKPHWGGPRQMLPVHNTFSQNKLLPRHLDVHSFYQGHLPCKSIQHAANLLRIFLS